MYIRSLYLTILCFTLVQLAAAQSNRYELIYVDNYKSATETGITDHMFDSIHARIQAVKSAKEDVLMFVSDNTNFDQTQNMATLESVYNGIVNHTHDSKPVNEEKDLNEIREIMTTKIEKEHPREIVLNYYVSSDIADLASAASSILVDFFPAELRMYSPDSKIKVNLFYPNSKKNQRDKLIRTFNFYDKGTFKDKGEFNAIAL